MISNRTMIKFFEKFSSNIHFYSLLFNEVYSEVLEKSYNNLLKVGAMDKNGYGNCPNCLRSEYIP